MLLLTTTSDLIKLVTSAAATVDVDAHYVDRDATPKDTHGHTSSAIASPTTTNIVGSPGSSTYRNVRTIEIWNRDASLSCTVTVQHYDGTNTIQLWKGTLAIGQGVTFDGSYWEPMDAAGFPLVSSSVGGIYLGTTILTSTSGTFYTRLATNKVRIRGVGGGGAGGGCTSASVSAGAAGGGGAGGYLEKTFSATPQTGYAYTIGAAGAGASGAGGGNGGNSTFVNGGTTYTAFGGTGAIVATVSGNPSSFPGGAGGVVATNGDLNAGGKPGENGHITIRATTSTGCSGQGGDSQFGSGGVSRSTAGNGNAALGYGSGGGGAFTNASAVRTGGGGTQGVWVVDEYS